MVLQCAILFGFLALGELIVWLLHIPVPSSIIGMLLLTCALKSRLIKEHSVDRIANFLIANLGFFFVPAGIGIMQCMGILRSQLIPIVAATILSTVLIITTTGWAHQLARRFTSRHNGISQK